MSRQSERMVTSDAVHDTGRRLWLSAADRRAIRQRCALAAELKLHSVSVLGSVWTLHHPHERHTQPRPESARQGTGTGATSQPSRSTQRSRARAAVYAALMQKAQAFRARSILTSWSRVVGSKRLATQLSTSQPASQSLLPPPPPPPPSTLPPLPPPPPPEKQSPPSPQQSTEGVRAPNKRAPSTPTAGDSPAGPRTKTRVVPLPLPPPSIPPSPPSPTPSSPTSTPATPAAEPPRAMRSLQLAEEPPPPSLPPSPPSPNGGKQPPGPMGPKQTGDSQGGAGGSPGIDGEAGGSRRHCDDRSVLMCVRARMCDTCSKYVVHARIRTGGVHDGKLLMCLPCLDGGVIYREDAPEALVELWFDDEGKWTDWEAELSAEPW
jgi:hypothetical protein